MTEKFQELRRRVAALRAMLDDPQPGCMTWCEAYAEHMKWISDYWRDN